MLAVPVKEEEEMKGTQFVGILSLCCTIMSLVIFIPALIFAYRYFNDECQHPDLVHVTLANVTIIATVFSFATFACSALCLIPSNDVLVGFALTMNVFFTIFQLAWMIVHAVSLFSDSLDCVGTGLYSWSLAQWIFGLFTNGCILRHIIAHMTLSSNSV